MKAKSTKKARSVSRRRLAVKSAADILLNQLSEDVERAQATLDLYVTNCADPEILEPLVAARNKMRRLSAMHPANSDITEGVQNAQKNLDSYIDTVANPDVLQSLVVARDSAKRAAAELRRAVLPTSRP